ncbi:MAG TPA: hypothetical protein VGI39_44890 [Polyangiaceae bacterium]|jgi:hypothetical protein
MKPLLALRLALLAAPLASLIVVPGCGGSSSSILDADGGDLTESGAGNGTEAGSGGGAEAGGGGMDAQSGTDSGSSTPDASNGGDGSGGQDASSGHDASSPDAATSCQAAGGTCVPVVPGACVGGTVLPNACGPGIGVECCLQGASDGGGGSFACGSLTCDGTSEYCQVSEGGVVKPDGGANVSYACQAIPASCTNDVTCSCIQAQVHAQQCSESGGDVTVTFQFP